MINGHCENCDRDKENDIDESDLYYVLDINEGEMLLCEWSREEEAVECRAAKALALGNVQIKASKTLVDLKTDAVSDPETSLEEWNSSRRWTTSTGVPSNFRHELKKKPPLIWF